MITMIAAVGKNLELGKNNDLIWHMPDDMKFFRTTTKEHTIIMGRKTFQSLGGLLPKRNHVVLTKNKDFTYEGVEVFHSVDEILKKYKDTEEENFIIGGAEIYKLFLSHADKMYLTCINDNCNDAEAFFPAFNELDYKVTVLNEIEDNGITAKIKEYIIK